MCIVHITFTNQNIKKSVSINKDSIQTDKNYSPSKAIISIVTHFIPEEIKNNENKLIVSALEC